jgi:hypothetical protein
MVDIVMFVYFIVVGTLAGCLTLLPSVRREARSSPRVRKIVAGGLSLVVLVFIFIVWSRLEISTDRDMLIGLYGAQRVQITPPELEGAVMNELWLQHIIPAPIQPQCYSSSASVCNQALSVGNPYRQRGDGLLPSLVRALGAAVVCALVSYGLGRPKKVVAAG